MSTNWTYLFLLDFGGNKYNDFDNFTMILLLLICIITCNQFTEYKTLLQTFLLQEQIDEINDMIKKLVNKKHIANIKDRKYDRIK